MPVCGRCGEENPDRARFCLACGEPLTTARAGREARKTVTVVFSDVTGSTALGERLDPESLRNVMSRYFDAMRKVLERHGGTVEKFIGDAVMAVFGVPVLHEDDALRAVRATWEMRAELESLNDELEAQWGVRLSVRTGVNTGEVVAGDPKAGESPVVGDPVNTAARLEQVARPGEILIGEPTARLVRDAIVTEPVDPMTLKGKAEAVGAQRLLGVTPGAAAFERRLDSPMVGRERERLLLQQAFERVVADTSCHLFTILGSAGVGKSRLAGELVGWCGYRARILSGRCLPYGEGITYWPIAEVLRQAAPLQEDEPPEEIRRKIHSLVAGEPDADVVAGRLAQLLGATGGAAEAEETRWAIRRLLETLSRSEPVVLILDDLHWAEPAFLDLVEYVADWTRDAPILLLCLARPELLDERPTWAGGKLNATSILLEPLNEGNADALIRNLLGEHMPEPVRSRILAAAEGNPLFVEETVGMLLDQGLLREEDGRWLGEPEDVRVPPTIQALIAARLERLSPDERAVLECGSVEGKEFHLGAVKRLVRESPAIEPLVQVLVRKELIRPARGEFAGEEAYAFRHNLIRDAAYGTIPKEGRARLHAEFAEWLEDAAGERLAEYEEIVGYHLEQAHRMRAELGRLTDEGEGLARRAAERLGRAGRRASDRDDMLAAANLLERAASLLPELDPERIELELLLGEALFDVGELSRAEELAERIERTGHSLGDEILRWRARLLLLTLRMNTVPGEAAEQALVESKLAIDFFERHGHEDGLYRAWFVRALATWLQAQSAVTTEALGRATSYAHATGNSRGEMEALGLQTMTAVWGPMPVEDAIPMIEQILERSGGNPRVEAQATISIGSLEGKRGNLDEARKFMAQGVEILDDMGLRVHAAANCQGLGGAELDAGRFEEAERILRAGYEALDRLGERAYLSTVAALLGEALVRQGRTEEAERFARRSEETADPADLASQVLWRQVHAQVLAAEGMLEEAERFALDALTIAEGTDFLDTHALTLETVAGVETAAGRPGDALKRLEHAAELYRRKGYTVRLHRVEEGMRALQGASPEGHGPKARR